MNIKRNTGAALTLLTALVLLPTGLGAETTVVTDVSFLALFGRRADGDPGIGTVTSGRLTFDAQGSREVKAQVALDFKASDAVVLSLHKAFVKARLGDLRLTLGKTRLSWGEGMMFNAGDVIFGGSEADLTADELRDNTLWLGSAYLSLGDFSFVEAVVLPPDYPLLAQTLWLSGSPVQKQPPPLAQPWETSAGGRFYHRLGEVKVEGGYLYSGKSAFHLPYLSFQGALGEVNLHLSSGLSLGRDDAWSQAWVEETRESWEISSGAYYQWGLGGGYDEETGIETPATSTLGLRLEALVRPWGEGDRDAAVPGALPGQWIQPRYALTLYPEVSWKDGNWTVFARSLVSPLDASAQTTGAVQWAPLQGFRLQGSLTLQTGDPEDTWGWDRAGGWQATLGSRILY